MKIETLNLNEMSATFDTDEEVLIAVPHAVAQAENNPNVWNVYLVLTTTQWSAVRMELQNLGFLPVGFVSRDAKTDVRLKRSIRPSGDGGHSACDMDLALPAPVLAKSATESSAIAELLTRPEYARFKDRF